MVMKTSTGWTRVIVGGLIGLGGAWAVRQFVNPKAGNAFGLGAAVIVLGQAAGVATNGKWGIPLTLTVVPQPVEGRVSASAPQPTLMSGTEKNIGAFMDTSYAGENSALNPPLA